METSSTHCLLHRDRRADRTLGSCGYCTECLSEIAAAVRVVPPGIVPRECAASRVGTAGWRALAGTGAPHWLAHELKVQTHHPHPRCAAGFPVRRTDLLSGRRELVRELPRSGDLWVDLDEDGCGLVIASRRGEGEDVEISIRGLIGSSTGTGARDFYRDLSGRGRFFR